MASRLLTLLTACTALAAVAQAKLRTCHARDLPAIDLFGAQITDLHAIEQRNYSFPLIPIFSIAGASQKPLDFCNITVTYTHPGWNDSLNVYIWLPFDDWNGRFLGQGGSGYAAGMEMAMGPAVSAGYAAAMTDGGHSLGIGGREMLAPFEAGSWALLSPGNVNWNALQDFASRALDDLPKIAKQVIRGFYGDPAKVSYWKGCSTGGRQGLMSAQRFPENYNGIIAAAPAVNWATFVPMEFWMQIVMKEAGYYPPKCEFETLRAAAVSACDELDGLKDGLISAPGLCNYDAKDAVGKSFDCEGRGRKISAKAADITNKIWRGPIKNGKSLWFGALHEMPLGGTYDMGFGGGGSSGLAGTKCDGKNENCVGAPFPIAESWIRDIVIGDPDFDPATLSEEEFFDVLHKSQVEFTSLIDTSEPDLSRFKAAGGKMITYHGLADPLIFANGSSNYYDRVLALDPNAKDFYRFFEAPGCYHCEAGRGPFPYELLTQLIEWVEEGKAPDTLKAATEPVKKEEAVKYRPLCPYPLVAAYHGGDANEASSFECADGFDVPMRHTEL